jgi:hypothetical protein
MAAFQPILSLQLILPYYRSLIATCRTKNPLAASDDDALTIGLSKCPSGSGGKWSDATPRTYKSTYITWRFHHCSQLRLRKKRTRETLATLMFPRPQGSIALYATFHVTLDSCYATMKAYAPTPPTHPIATPTRNLNHVASRTHTCKCAHLCRHFQTSYAD